MATQAQLAAVQQLYVGYLGRAGDSAGQQFWANAIANGTATIKSVATGFTLSAEYKAAYAGLSNDALVDKVYNNVLGRASDAAGKAFWVDALAKGTVTADTLVATIVTNLGALDQATINNKVFVAQTYTDTAGANYNVAAGTASIVGVNSTPASVTAALGAISNGTLAGLVPGLVQINAVAAAQAAVTAFEKATATSTLATTTVPTLDTNKDGSVTLAELNAAALATKTAHDTLTSGDSTVVASAKLTDLTTALAAAKAAAVAANNATLVGNLDTALATQATVKGTAADVIATAAAKASAQAGFTSAIGSSTTVSFATLDSKTLAAGDITDIASLYSALTGTSVPPISGAERTALVTEVNKLGAFGTALVAAADKEVAVAKADAAVTAATTATGATGAAYVTAGNTQKAQADVVTKATASDVTAAAIKVAIDAHTALDTTSTAAATALTQFQAANAAKVTLADISGKIATDVVNGDATKSDVFYFAAKAPSAADVTIGTFGAGDVVVVGSGYTFNSGALSTGNNSAAEMFLVQGANGVQIVLENSVFGSATATVGANGVVAASPTDGVSVITLTGVTIDHVSVANGVVSYV
jgi:hypothetical protein